MRSKRARRLRAAAAVAAVSAVWLSAAPAAGAATSDTGTQAQATSAADAWRTGWQEQPQWGGRLGYLDTAGNLKVKLRPKQIVKQVGNRLEVTTDPGSDWVTVAADVADFQLLDWRLLVRKKDGTLWLGEGALNQPLRQIDSEVSAFQLTLTRIGILRNDGTFRVLEPGGRPETVATGVRAFQVDNMRVAALGHDGTLWMQQGGAVQGLDRVATDVEKFQIEREWVAYTTRGAKRLMVAKWDLGTEAVFKERASGISDFEMEIVVDYSKDFPSRMHMAAVDKLGRVRVSPDSRTPDIRLAPVTIPATRQVSWAKGRLYAYGADSVLRTAELADTGRLSPLSTLGKISGYRANAEDAVVLRRGGSLNVLQAQPLYRALGAADLTPKARILPKAGQTKPGTLASSTAGIAEPDFKAQSLGALPTALSSGSSVASTLGGQVGAAFQVSSIRPDFVRRPMAGANVTTGRAPLRPTNATVLPNLLAIGGSAMKGSALDETVTIQAAVANGSHTMNKGQSLEKGQYLQSAKGRYRLFMQGDGNVVQYTKAGKAVWSTNTAGSGAVRLVLQGDGNLVLRRADNSVVLHTSTGGKPVNFLRLQEDSNLVLYGGTNNATAYWSHGLVPRFPHASTPTPYYASYVNNYAQAAKGCWSGHCVPNIVDGSKTWYWYVSSSSVCVDTGYARAVSGTGRKPRCGPAIRGYDFQVIASWMRTSGGAVKAMPGEITPDSYALIPMSPSVDRMFDIGGTMYNEQWQRSIPNSNINSAPIQFFSSDYVYYKNLAAAMRDVPFWNRGGLVVQIDSRATAVEYTTPNRHVDIFIRGVTNGDNIFADLRDVIMDAAYMRGVSGTPSPTVSHVRSYLLNNGFLTDATRIFGHSLGTMDATILGNTAWAGQVWNYSPPFFMSPSYLVDRSYVNFSHLSGYFDPISNGLTFNVNQQRINAGVDLWQVNTFPSGSVWPLEGHNLRHYLDAHFNTPFYGLPTSWPN